MKDNRKIPVIPDFVSGFNVAPENDTFGGNWRPTGLFTAHTLLDVRFNKFIVGSADVRSWIKNRAPQTGAEIGNTKDLAVVTGIPNSAGAWQTVDGHFVDADIYGRIVYSKEGIYGNDIQDIVPYVQRALPLGNSALGSRAFVVKENAQALDPYAYINEPNPIVTTASTQFVLTSGVSYIFKFKLEEVAGNIVSKNIITIASPSSATSMCIYRNNDAITAEWKTDSGTTATNTINTLPMNTWLTAIVWFRPWGSGPYTDIRMEIFRVDDGTQAGASGSVRMLDQIQLA